MTSGYIKLYRQLEENHLWTAEPFTKGQAWVDLLLMANYETSKFTVRGIWVTVNPGQLARGERFLAKRWSWSRIKTRMFLDWLEIEQQIKQEKNRVITVISIVNWEQYQGNSTTDRTTDRTTERPQIGQQKDQYKNVKKNKEGKEVIQIHIPDFVNRDLWNSFIEMRKKIKAPLTPKAEELIITKLIKMQEEGQNIDDVLKQSIERSWRGVFPVKIDTADKPAPVKLPRYNEDSHYLCIYCNKPTIKPAVYGDRGAGCKECLKIEMAAKDKRLQGEWANMTAEARAKQVEYRKKLNLTIPEWMEGK